MEHAGSDAGNYMFKFINICSGTEINQEIVKLLMPPDCLQFVKMFFY